MSLVGLCKVDLDLTTAVFKDRIPELPVFCSGLNLTIEGRGKEKHFQITLLNIVIFKILI